MASPNPHRSGSSQSRNATPRAPTSRPLRASAGLSISNEQSNGSSSPLYFRSSSVAEEVRSHGARTPRPSGTNGVESSPIRYLPSSSPRHAARRSQAMPSNLGSDSSNLFVQTTPGHTRARDRRGDIASDTYSSGNQRARALLLDEHGRPVRQASDAVTFSNLDPNTSEADELGGPSGKFIWGSTISTLDTSRVAKDFLLNFRRKYRMIKDGELQEGSTLPEDHAGNSRKYVEAMEAMLDLSTCVLNLDMKDLLSYPPTVKLWHQLQDYPDEGLAIFDNVIKELMVDLAEHRMNQMRSQPRESSLTPSNLPSSASEQVQQQQERHQRRDVRTHQRQDIPDMAREAEDKGYRVRPFNLDLSTNLRDLNPKDIDTLVTVKGLVIRTTPVIPDMRDAFFQCTVCNTTLVAEIFRGKIAEPTECPREACKSRNSMQIVHNRCGFADKQVIKLQETPDSVPDGQTPHSVSICAYDELVDFCKAGDRVEITGIFKCNPVRINARQRTVKGIFKTYVDACHIQKVDKRRMGIDASVIEQEIAEEASNGQSEVRKVSAEEEEKIKQTAAREDVYELLSRSLAPSIYELDDVKKGILLQLFGGTNKVFDKGGNPKYRGDINVLLCGDPSTSKSQLLQYVHKIAPRGVYTSGKGSSAVGLTAYVTRDPETRQLVLESGALVLSDGGVCCIDEFDKMSDATRSVLHEVMEQQTVSIAKAGIITTLNARTSILASANPIGSKYNPNLPVPQNIDLPPTLLSRFDLVYLVLDRIDEQTDRRLAKHLVGMYLEDAPENANAGEILPIEFLTAYISYAKANVHPVISAAAATELVNAYVDMRKLGEDIRSAERRITATTRQLESMIRLAEAHAKMRLSPEVLASDVREAVRLIKSALKQAATDARTGLIDMSLLTDGTSASERKRRQDLKSAVTALIDNMTRQGASVRLADLSRSLADQSSMQVENDELMDVLKMLQQEGHLQMHGEGPRRTIRRIVV